MTFVPARLARALVVSPFVRPDFVSALVERTQHLQLVSTPEAIDALDDATHARLDARREAQGSPVLYQVSELTDPEDPADGNIQGLHAKLLLTEDARQTSATFVGSANATGPGWGLGAPANVEAMAEMRPGIGIDRFVAGFIRESKTKVHPWVVEYGPSEQARARQHGQDRTPDAHRAAGRGKPGPPGRLRRDRQRLTLGRLADRALSILNREANVGLTFEIAPLLLTERPGAWTPVESLALAAREFDDVPVQEVTAFVAVRARSESPPLERTRLMLARLNLSEAALDQRDDAVRQKIMADADPAAVLAALVRGLAYLRAGQPGEGGQTGEGVESIHRLLGETHLEGLLQAVAAEPGLIAEMRLLLAPTGGTEFGASATTWTSWARQLRLGVTP